LMIFLIWRFSYTCFTKRTKNDPAKTIKKPLITMGN